MLRGGRTAAGHLGATTRLGARPVLTAARNVAHSHRATSLVNPAASAPTAPAPTIRKSVLLKNTASLALQALDGALALLRFFAAQGGEPAPASHFRSGT